MAMHGHTHDALDGIREADMGEEWWQWTVDQGRIDPTIADGGWGLGDQEPVGYDW